jgi:hypothetical protein
VHDREAADEDRELAREHVGDAEGLVARQGGAVRRLVEQVGGPLVAGRRERLGDRDLDAGEPGSRQPVQAEDVPAVVADADRLLDAELLGLRPRRLEHRQGIVEGDPEDLVHGVLLLRPTAGSHTAGSS